MEITSAVGALSALAHPARLEAFRLLVRAGPGGLAAGDVARRLAAPANTTSSNLSILAQAGLIDRRRDGRSVVYRARFETMAALLDYLMQDCCGGAPEVCGSLVESAARVRCAPGG